MRLDRYVLIVGLTLMTFSLSSAQQITNCNGKWTNQPCVGDVSYSFNERQRAETSVEKAEPVEQKTLENKEPLAPRTDLARKLRRISDDFRRRKGIFLTNNELDGLKKQWEDRSIPYSECLKMFNEKKDKLVEQNKELEENRIQKERNAIEFLKIR